KRAPKAVESLVPSVLNVGGVQKVLQHLVQEKVSIRDLLTIVETLADYGLATQDPAQLTEFVRAKMGRTIINPYLGETGILPIITLSPKVDEILAGAMRPAEQGGYLALEPGMAQQIIQTINRATEDAMVADGQPVLLVTPQIRSQLAQLLNRFIPTLAVISQAEIPADIKIQSAATVDF
ncbi:MAG: FHIPEP family type III secretion protein, partial [Syntrophaceae bacterium]|nr:FHIPEP family type III secretion protein [Syntrophaceae bacterium]